MTSDGFLISAGIEKLNQRSQESIGWLHNRTLSLRTRTSSTNYSLQATHSQRPPLTNALVYLDMSKLHFSSTTTPSLARFSFQLCFGSSSLLRLGKTNRVVAEIVDGVPLPQKRITENGQRTSWLGDVKAHKGADAAALDLEDVVVGGDGEVVASESEGEVGKGVALIALNGVLTVEAFLGTDFLVEQLSESGGQSDERGTSVEDGAGLVDLGGLVAEGDGVEVDFPVCLPAQRDLDHVAVVVILVHATEDALRLRALVIGIGEVEGEDGLVDQTLVDHVVERWDDLVDGDGVVSETHDTVKAAEGKRKARLRGCLSEVLVFDGEIANAHGVLADISLQFARSVPDGEIGAILLVGARLAVVVLAVEIAGDGAAVLAWHPEVGAAGIKHHLELLRGCSDGDLGEVLGV